MTDAVITYVDGNDPVWQEEYRRSVGGDPLAKRFRDWGTLRYLLRGIERFLPFVDKVHLVVSSRSQVPSWVSDRVDVVLHEDIIPKEYLPVFNSTAIEMFLWKISSLAERFLYFNDDMFPVAPCTEDDFFPGGKCAMGFSHHLLSGSLYKQQTKASDRLARKALGMRPGLFFIRPQHTLSPMLRSLSEAAYRAVESDILSAVTALRKPFNHNQYFYLDYLYYGENAISRRIDNKHMSLAVSSIEKIEAFLSSPTHKHVCINDVTMPDEAFENMRPRLLSAFDRLLPEKSSFEK